MNSVRIYWAVILENNVLEDYDLKQAKDNLEKEFLSASTHAQEVVLEGKIGEKVIEISDNYVVFTDNIHMNFNALDFSNDGVIGSGEITNFKTALVLEYSIREMNKNVGHGIYRLNLTFDGDNNMNLSDLDDFLEVNSMCGNDHADVDVRKLCENLGFVKPIFDIAKAVKQSEINPFF